jgi:outer membrane receptor protein involved in Fe transport
MLLKSSAVYGITSQQQNNSGDVSLTQIRNAVTIEEDGNGGYQCADPAARIEGCVPVNPFSTVDSLAGQAGITGFSPEAMEYIGIATGQTGKTEQLVLSSVLSGELPYAISDEEMGFAVGAEYRKEKAEEIPDSFRQLGLARDSAIEPIKGSFDVFEVYGELFAPVTDWLNVSLAARVGNYSTVGTTSTYRLGLDAPINDMVRFRASQSRSVRAPNISDLFSVGSTSVAGTDTDACNGTSNSGTDNISINCASIAAIADRMAADPNGEFNLVGSEANNTSLRQTGNLELKEETADSFTLGVVFTPIESLSVSLDYYDIEIEDGIARVTPAVSVDRCHDVSPSEFDASCGGNLVRDVNDGPILHLRSTLINADTISTSGLDVEVAYIKDDLNVRFLANYLNGYDVETTTGSEAFVGRPQFPEFRYTVNANYTFAENYNLFAQVTYRDETQAYLDETNLSDDLNTLDAVFNMNVRASYQINDSLNVYIGSNNLLDQQPDILPRGAAAGTNTEPRAYDVIGRQVFAGVKFAF